MIGDVLASSIICNNLKAMYPAAKVDYLIYKHTTSVVENNLNIDEIIVFEDKYRKSKFELFKFLLFIKKRKYDLVIDVYGKIESNLVVLFSGAKKKIALYRKHSHFLFTDTLIESFKAKTNAGAAIDNRLNLLSPLDPKIKLDCKPKIYLTETEIKNGKLILVNNNVDLSRKIFMISIVGSEPRKTYPKLYMAEILDFIVQKTDATLLFNYIPNQYESVKEIVDLCKTATQKNCKTDLIPGNIRDFLSLTVHCNALIGNEGGAVNMAKAIDTPTFTIFSPWVIKEAWNSFENETTNLSVHLMDYKPEMYQGKNAFEFKDKAFEFYQEFYPYLFEKKLLKFIEFN